MASKTSPRHSTPDFTNSTKVNGNDDETQLFQQMIRNRRGRGIYLSMPTFSRL
jgi:hypothetical protein